MLISMETTLITLNLLASVVFMIISMTDLGRMLALSWYGSGWSPSLAHLLPML